GWWGVNEQQAEHINSIDLIFIARCGFVWFFLYCTVLEFSRNTTSYGIVIDAGSSRSTLFVYKWPSSRENNTGIVSQHSSCRVKGSGISGYANNPGNAGRSLKTCLEQALHDIPESSHKQTPLYLGATAGMRLLTDSKAEENVLTAVADTMRSYRFDFRGAKVLTGQEEGLFGWVTVNYLQENFIKYNWIGQWIKPRKRTVGAMDFGGASTQLTFETTKSMENPNSLMVLKLYEHEYKVYTHSYLCYGRDQVMKKVMFQMMKQQFGPQVMNPCMPTGYQTNRTLGFIYNSPCIKEERPTNISDSSIVTFIGSSNPTKCKNYLQEIFDFQSCNFSKCSFNGIYQPRLTGDFMAFSAFYYTINFLKTTLKKDITTPHELEEAAKSICGDSIEQIERLVDYCTTSLYIHILTIEGYKFNNETFKNISFQLKAGDTEVGWALGYMLNLTNIMPAEQVYLHKSQAMEAWAVLIVLFIVVVVMGVVIFIHRKPTDNAV
uniref:Ectonucleoside triphosphate diphosphohydrolase 2 n=1 Tax=Callorhinchus milii TaxID=7868 RepID=A0A4W3JMB7_CALMI